MNLYTVYKRLVVISPYIEIFVRFIYWHNISLLRKIRPDYKKNNMNVLSGNIDNIVDFLRSKGIKDGSLLIVHSSYDMLSHLGLSPNEFVDLLLNLIGKKGTLVMPVIRKFEELNSFKNLIEADLSDITCLYDVKKTPVITGYLPFCLMRKKGSYTSRYPLNPVTAFGPLAEDMVKNNLKGELPSPHGENSAWKFCVDHHAIVLGLGINLGHHLTIAHVAEEAYPGWPIENWFRQRNFIIKDGDYIEKKIVQERRPKWGKLYEAELNYNRDLVNNNILQEYSVESVKVSIVSSEKLISYLRSKNSKGYPYIYPFIGKCK